MNVLPPRVVIAGTASGVGKTTVATGVMAALRRRGVRVAGAKVGPDFIDPGYHALATGGVARNLDSWLCGAEAIGPLAGRAGAGADVLVIEGVMGLFDGAADPSAEAGALPVASTAEIALLLEAPVVLVVDAAALSGSVAAIVHGFATLDSRVDVCGVVLNRVGSDGHEAMLRDALAPLSIPVLGALRRDERLVWRDRHLGLVPVVEQVDRVTSSLDALAAVITERCHLDEWMRLAGGAARLEVGEPALPSRVGQARIAVAGGKAFSFSYTDNLDALESAGAEVVPFDPLVDEALPEGVDGLVAGGGFPEMYAGELAANERLLADVRARVSAGLVTWAECGGLLWLAEHLDGHRLAGVVPASGAMTERLSLGYREGTTLVDTPLGPAGTSLRGHEFHYSDLTPAGDALSLRGRFGSGVAGHASPALLASYLHIHLGSPAGATLAERFVATCRRGDPHPPDHPARSTTP